ncbi:LOW QUALITY PROTEIN: sodium channel subunit beta-1 [Ctenopharyngodon idella]|uniref:LOW QUALITY PROTEIN: sodium channel subunit beta-1 n=1 Tax=Ctenopharyngodon idella TaxID=7959 RepID=UPI002231E0A9|nr:LOW QUALITY PROTEIN: sodium channel subunit beta-1 [Ctenopharyngodon idella]
MSLGMISFLALFVFFIQVPQGQTGCAEVDSMTEAVAGENFLLGCISCKRREEVPGSAIVDWHFKPAGTEEFIHIFQYEYPFPTILHENYEGRLEWQGTMGTKDVQIGAIFIHNVTYNDTGTYLCTFHRTLYLLLDEEHVIINKEVELTVVEKANPELTAVISEIIMYVLIVVLQLWMIGVLIYCYRKIYAENEAREARKATRSQNKFIDSKDPCDGVYLE